jgi:hypothetical protein
MKPTIYIFNIVMGFVLGFKYMHLCKYIKSKYRRGNREGKFLAQLCCYTSFMFFISLVVGFSLLLYKHYMHGHDWFSDMAILFVFIGILPYFFAHIKEG